MQDALSAGAEGRGKAAATDMAGALAATYSSMQKADAAIVAKPNIDNSDSKAVAVRMYALVP